MSTQTKITLTEKFRVILSGGSPIYLWVTPISGTVEYDGFSKEDVQFIEEYWKSGNYDVCISMLEGDFPAWITTKNWQIISIEGKYFFLNFI